MARFLASYPILMLKRQHPKKVMQSFLKSPYWFYFWDNPA
jgi:hypothetical protein